tara:strand:- start:21859 stop:23745 length:1887 start_codon:yes stop_codon:yes gene_type:complete
VRQLLVIFFCFLISSIKAQETVLDHSRVYLDELEALNFKAIDIPGEIKEGYDPQELSTLAEIIYWAGQRPRPIVLIDQDLGNATSRFAACVGLLSRGYYDLYEDPLKKDVFKNFYEAYNISVTLGNDALRKRALLALMEYYTFEIVQADLSYEKYLDEFDELRRDAVDDAWYVNYMLVLNALKIGGPNDEYYVIANKLGAYIDVLEPRSPLRSRLLFERAIFEEIQEDFAEARSYYNQVLYEIGSEPYLKYIKYACYVKLAFLDHLEEDYDNSMLMLEKASEFRDVKDTLRSTFYDSYYSSLNYGARGDFADAYNYLNDAFTVGYNFDMRSNTLLTSRLNVEFETERRIQDNRLLRANVAQEKQKRILTFWLGFGVVFILSLGSVLVYKNIKKAEKLAKQQAVLERQNKEKLLKEQELSGIDAMIAGQEKERQRIANDLHDNLGSLLATIKMHFQSLKGENRPGVDNAMVVNKTDGLIDEAYQKVRQIAHARYAGVPAQEGLLPAVKNFAKKVSLVNNLYINVEDHGMEGRLENSLEINLFRIVQELITNIIKHAGASNATIHLTHHDNDINIMVEDNGKGFDVNNIRPSEGMGIHSIEKRVEHMGGSVTVDSAPGRGTTIIIDIPVS